MLIILWRSAVTICHLHALHSTGSVLLDFKVISSIKLSTQRRARRQGADRAGRHAGMQHKDKGAGDALTFIDMGTHLLHNVGGAQLLVQIAIPGLEERARWYPALRSIALSPGALPATAPTHHCHT